MTPSYIKHTFVTNFKFNNDLLYNMNDLFEIFEIIKHNFEIHFLFNKNLLYNLNDILDNFEIKKKKLTSIF